MKNYKWFWISIGCLFFWILFLPWLEQEITSYAKGSDQEDWIEYIEQICKERSICPELMEAIIERESKGGNNGNCKN